MFGPIDAHQPSEKRMKDKAAELFRNAEIIEPD